MTLPGGLSDFLGLADSGGGLLPKTAGVSFESSTRARVIGSDLSTHPGFPTSERWTREWHSLGRLAGPRRQKPLHSHGADAGLSGYLPYREPALP